MPILTKVLGADKSIINVKVRVDGADKNINHIFQKTANGEKTIWRRQMELQYIQGPTVSQTAGQSFAEGVLLDSGTNSGKVLLCPLYARNVWFYTPPSGTITVSNVGTATIGISHAGTQDYNYMGGIKIPDGRVVLAAHEVTYTRVLTANCTSYTQVNKGASNNNTYGGGCYIGGNVNRVVFTPHGAARIWSYYIVNNVMVDSSIEHNQGSRAFTGHGILLNDGRILFVPYDASNVGLYTPSTSTGTYTNGAAVTAGDSKYRGGVKLPDGRVLLVPFNAFYIGLYNPSNNTVTNVAAHGRGSYAFSGGVLLPEEGKVVLIPYRSAYVGIYDIATNTYSNGPAHNAAYRGSGEYAGFWHGGVYLPEKKTIIMIPRGCNYIGLLKIV